MSSGGKANGRRCGRKPICRVKSDRKRGKYQWLLPTIGVDEDLRILLANPEISFYCTIKRFIVDSTKINNAT
jgi:hypothetical protein